MNKNLNGFEATQFTVVITNRPGELETVLTPLKSINIVGIKISNNGDNGSVQFVVEPQDVKQVNSILTKGGFFFHTTVVYGVYLTDKPGSLFSNIVKPVAKFGVNITSLFTTVSYGTPLVYVGFDNAKLVIPTLRSIPVPTTRLERSLVTA